MRLNFRLRLGSNTFERAALVIGFALSLAATVGSQVYLAPVTTHIQATIQSLDETWARLKIIRAANALFGLLHSFEALIYLVPADFENNRAGADAVLELATRAIHARHDAVRNYFAQAAAAGEIDYHQVMQRYDALIAAETKDWNLQTYTATNDLPAQINTQVAADRWNLEKAVFQLRADFLRSQIEADERAMILTMVSTGGASILFILALVAAREAPSLGGPPGEAAKAEALMHLALRETRRRLSERTARG